MFGSPAYLHVPNADRQKLDLKAMRGIYVGENETQKASRVYVESTGKTHISRDVKIYESLAYSTPISEETEDVTPPPIVISPEAVDSLIPVSKRKLTSLTAPLRQSKRGHVAKKIWPSDNVAVSVDVPKSEEHNMGFHASFAFNAYGSISIYPEPRNFREAMEGSEGPLWKKAADEEMSSHVKKITWTVMPLSRGHMCIPSGWNFTVKTDRDGLPRRR